MNCPCRAADSLSPRPGLGLTSFRKVRKLTWCHLSHLVAFGVPQHRYGCLERQPKAGIPGSSFAISNAAYLYSVWRNGLSGSLPVSLANDLSESASIPVVRSPSSCRQYGLMAVEMVQTVCKNVASTWQYDKSKYMLTDFRIVASASVYTSRLLEHDPKTVKYQGSIPCTTIPYAYQYCVFDHT